jgi:hypothetical protein
MSLVKTLALILCAAASLLSQTREGDFDIRFEPTAKLQTQAPIPYQITVRDALGKPVVQARVTLQIETTDHRDVKVYKAPEIDRGVYMAKPMFPHSGQWNVYVEVRRSDQMSARAIEYSIPD